MSYISNKYITLNNLAKYQYFYTGDFISLRHFKKKLALPLQKFFETFTFYHFFTIFKGVRFAIFQVNADSLINQLTKYFYTRHLTLLLYFTKKFALSIAEPLKPSTFYHIFTSFDSGSGVLYFIQIPT